MTLADILNALGESDPDAALAFTADGVPVRNGYHLTEFQIASIRSMTCGGDTDKWQEARIQLMDGHGFDRAMKVGRFAEIAAKVTGKFPEMSDLPLQLEFAPDNEGLGIYRPEIPVARDGTVTIPLVSGTAVCKPALGTTSCCGAGACC